MILETLLAHPLTLAATIVAVSALNYAIWSVSLRAASDQSHLDLSPSMRRPASRRAELTQHFGLPLAVALLAVPGARGLSQLFGGYLILQICTLSLNIEAWLRWRILRMPGIVEGRLIPTAEYQYRTAAARIVPLAFFCTVVAVLFSSATFAFGALLLCATAIGWHRRGAQAHRSARAQEPER